ncbi:MAG: hypothetical protein Q9195_007841 [Heterodermia aff. obscurata]
MGSRAFQQEVSAKSSSHGTTIAAEWAGSQKPKNKQSLDYVLRTGLAGGLAGCAAKTVVAPLDRVKILFQASNPQFAKYTGSWFGVVTAMRDIKRQDGMRGLFRGHSATLLKIFPYAAIKFLTYEQVRHIIIPSPAHETPLRRLSSGSLAGLTSVFITYPLEVIRVRLAFDTKRDSRSSLSKICRQIYHEHPPKPSSTIPLPGAVAATPESGLVNFYRGFSPTLVGMVPYAGISFLTHDTAGDWLRSPALAPYTMTTSTTTGRPILRYWAELLSGGFAGMVSQTAAYPLEVIRRRMQVGGAVGDGHRLGMGETTATIWRERGWRGFFVGLGIGYVKVVPMAAVSFFVYERGKVVLGV